MRTLKNLLSLALATLVATSCDDGASTPDTTVRSDVDFTATTSSVVRVSSAVGHIPLAQTQRGGESSYSREMGAFVLSNGRTVDAGLPPMAAYSPLYVTSQGDNFAYIVHRDPARASTLYVFRDGQAVQRDLSPDRLVDIMQDDLGNLWVQTAVHQDNKLTWIVTDPWGVELFRYLGAHPIGFQNGMLVTEDGTYEIKF